MAFNIPTNLRTNNRPGDRTEIPWSAAREGVPVEQQGSGIFGADYLGF